MHTNSVNRIMSAALLAAVALSTNSTFVFAAYSDVPAGVWYEDAVSAFMDAGYLDSTQARFRGSDTANRAEFVKLVVELNGGILSTPPAVPSFDDVATGAWYYGYFEEAGKEGWVRGDGDCYGSRPCYSRPGANINRAEAAALIVRAFGLEWTGAAPQFVDNPSGQWYTDVIQTAADYCVLQGDDSTGRVRPGDNMNRAEMVVMLYRVDQGLVYGVDCGDEEVSGEPMIVDAVATSATTVEVEFNWMLDQESAEDPAMYAVTNAAELAINSVTLLDDDLVEIVLGEAMEPSHEYTLTLTDMLTADGWEFSDAMTFTGYSPVALGEGLLEVSLSASNPVTDTVPKGAVGVVMLSADMTASCDDSVIVEDLTILHEGFGDEVDIDGVYIAIDGARVTRKRTIDSEDQTAEMRFSSPLVIDPCETVTVDIVADYAAGADTSAEHNLVVELSSDVISNAQDVTGNFPIRGNSFRVAAVTSGVVTVEYRTVTPDEVEVGDTGVVIGKFEVSVDSVEDQTFYSMTIEQNSSASDGDFTNIAIRRTDGTVLTNTVSQTVGDFVTLVFDPPFTVLEGDRITLEMIGDIVGGAGDQVIMHFEENSDLFAVGSLYGYGVNGQLYGSQVTLPTETATLPDTVTIDAGEFTIGIDGPSTQDYTRDDNDAVLANIEFQTGGEKIDIKDLFVAVVGRSVTGAVLCASGGADLTACGTAGSDDNINEVLEDVEIRNTVTGRTIDGVRLTAANASGQRIAGGETGTFQVYRFDDFIVHGDETWEFRVDFIDNGAGNHPLSGDQFRIHMCGEPTHILNSEGALTANTTTCDFGGLLATAVTDFQMEIEGLSTGDKVGDVRPRGNIAGNFHRIANATLTIAGKLMNESSSVVANSKKKSLVRFEARAGEAEDVLLTEIVFESAADTLVNGQNYTLWVDSDGDSKVDTILEDGVTSQSETVTFKDLAGGGYVIPAEETIVFEVKADIAASPVGSSPALSLRFNTGAIFISAEELDDGSSLSSIRTTNPGGSVVPDTEQYVDGGTNADIQVSTVANIRRKIKLNAGYLVVTQDSTPVRSRQLLGGELSEEIFRLNLLPRRESIDVTDIVFTATGADASRASANVQHLELFKEGETEHFAIATTAGCGSEDVPSFSMCANMEDQELVIKKDIDTDILVRARMNSDTTGALSAEVIQFYINPNPSTLTGAVRARGTDSSKELEGNNNDSSTDNEVLIGTSDGSANVAVTGPSHRSVLAKITSITNANPEPNGTGVPTGVTPFGQFKISAAAHNNSNNGLNDVVLSGVIFNVTASDVDMNASSFRLYNKADSTVGTACTTYKSDGTLVSTSTASGSLQIRCDQLIAATVSTEIDEGTDETFVLEGNVSNPKKGTSTSTLQASLQNFDSITRTTFDVFSGNSHIEWHDVDGGAAAGTNVFLWVEYPETTVTSTTYQS